MFVDNNPTREISFIDEFFTDCKRKVVARDPIGRRAEETKYTVTRIDSLG